MGSGADRSAVVVAGVARSVEYAICRNGRMPARDFIEEELSLQERAALLALLKRMADYGDIPNPKQFKPVRDGIFEFKKRQIRVFCFRRANRWLLTNGYAKKRDKLDPDEIARAIRVMSEHLARESRTR